MLTISIYVFALVLLIILLVIAQKSKGTKPGRLLYRLSYGLFLLLILELFTVGTYRIFAGLWAFQGPETKNHILYENHPYLVAVPTPNIAIEFAGDSFTHNRFGFRGAAPDREHRAFRIAAIGGSTTYGVGVSDRETWPYLLDSMLGPDYEVLNLGIPGHSSVEHVIYSSLRLPPLEPDLVIYHTGINDVGKMHIQNLQDDYSQFHAPLLFGATAQCYRTTQPNFGIVKMSLWCMQYMGLFPLCDFHRMAEHQGKRSTTFDPKAGMIYSRNLATMEQHAKALNAQVLFVPQLLSQEGAMSGHLDWWIPYVENEVLLEQLGNYNQLMLQTAESTQSAFAHKMLDRSWTKEDFVDACHLNPSGNRVFAELLAQQIRQMKASASSDTLTQ